MREKEICWNITARCNQSCKYCHRFLGIKDLSYDDNLKILNNLISSGVTAITWTGGEALMIEGLDKLLKISKDNNIKNKLITNGRLLTNDKIDELHDYLDSITLSIDSVFDDTNEELGRGRYHFKEIKNILDYIKEKKYSVKMRINSVVCKNNLNDFNELIKFLNDYNIYSWRVFKFMPLREKAIKNKSEFNVSLEAFNKIVENIRLNSNISNIDTRMEKDMEKKYILILANGDIYKTESGVDYRIGNALIDRIGRFI